MKNRNLIIILICSLLGVDLSWGQGLSKDDYKKALWMTTRFYGGQRSGENNWLIYDHLPSGVNSNLKGLAFRADRDGSIDLSGGWHDCGDHVKFGQTQFYSAYVLLKTYEQFKEGFDDYYSADYAGYGAQSTSGSAPGWQWEGNGHDPNGIPDILDELKHETDFLIKCTPNGSTFYYQIGDGGSSGDHATNNTAVTIQTLEVNKGGNNDNGIANPSGPFRGAYKNPNDGAMASFCAATLALMSKQYEPFDPAYAALCLTHAQNAYTYAASHIGQAAGTANGGFYSAHDNAYNPWAICLGEMYKATGQESYKTTMNALTVGLTGSPQVKPNVNYSFDYANVGELALFVMAELGNATAKTSYNSHYTNHWINGTNYTGEGNYKGGGGWGQLRYTGNAALIVALYSKLNNLSTLNAKVYDNVDYILGSNNAKQSFVVGYSPSAIGGVTYAEHPHHRNLYLRDDTPSGTDMVTTSIPAKNIQFGALVGGNKSSSGSYNDTWTEYVNTEVCIDYNAGILGGLAAINAFDHPIDTNKFLTQCASPSNLGGDQTLCGVGSIVLNTELGTKSGRKFQWFKDDVPQGVASSSITSKTITEAGVWKVVVDSSGECSRTSSVTITGTLPNVDLGGDVELCTPAQVTLQAGVSGNGLTYSWKKDNEVLAETGSELFVAQSGIYSLTVSASGCASKTGEVEVTSLLPETQNGTRCGTGAVELSVLESGGPFEWYSAAANGTLLHTGNTYSPTVSNTTTYYVEDAGSIDLTVGLSSTNNSLTTEAGRGTAQSELVLTFDALTTFNLDGITLGYYSYNCQGTTGITINVKDSGGNTVGSGSATVPCQSTDPTVAAVVFDQSIEIPAGTEYTMDAVGSDKNLSWYQNGASYPYGTADVVSITGPHSSMTWAPNSSPGFFDWVISTGSNCDRAAVIAEVDCTTGINDFEEGNIQFFPNPVQNDLTVVVESDVEQVELFDQLGRIVATSTSNIISMDGLEHGAYIVKVKTQEAVYTSRVVKK